MTPPRIDKSLNLQNLISVVSLATLFIGWMMRMESRVSVVEARQTASEAYVSTAIGRVEDDTKTLIRMHLNGSK